MEFNILTDKELKILTETLKQNSIKNGECIEWTGKLSQGYGYFMALKYQWRVHRLSYLIQHGHIPDGLFICHKCNNRKCINIDHLYAGTPKQNSQDLKNAPYYQAVKKKIVENKRKNMGKKRKDFKDFSDSFLTVKEFSEILNVHPNTVLGCLKNGYIQGIRTGIGKRSSYRIPKSEFSRMGLFNFEEMIRLAIEKRLQEKRNLL